MRVGVELPDIFRAVYGHSDLSRAMKRPPRRLAGPAMVWPIERMVSIRLWHSARGSLHDRLGRWFSRSFRGG